MRNSPQKSITRRAIKHAYLILFYCLSLFSFHAYGFERQDHTFPDYIKKEKKINIHPKIIGNNKRKHLSHQKDRIMDYNSVGFALRINLDF